MESSIIRLPPVQIVLTNYVLASAPILDELHITSKMIEEKNINLIAYLIYESRIRKIILNGDNFNEKNLEIICQQLIYHPTIETVIFHACLFTNRDLHCIANMVRLSTCIRTISIDQNVFSITHEGAAPLIAAIRANAMITRFGIMKIVIDHPTIRAIADMIRYSHTLEEISLKGCQLEARDIECLANAFRYNLSILRINLMNTNITDDSAPYIMDIIEHNRGLRELHMQDTRMTALTVERIKYLSKAIKGMQVFA
jgi:hypothetical protein